ncbi:MAG: acyl-CoA dehydrogenase [Chromatiaceae bacterium]|nr:acyl-CoA dehydrogenase [Chromatiaceae bacterium]
MWIIASLAAVGIVWALAYWGAGTGIWIAALAAGLALFTAGSGAGWLVMTPLWLVAAAIVVFLGIPRVRQRWITAPLFRRFRRVMPPMSQTEQEALEAGSVWWDAELFTGQPDWHRLLNLPAPHLSDDEQAFLDNETETLCRLIDDWTITHEDRDLPAEAWRYIKDKGFFGLILPEQYGGKAFSALAHSEVVMKLASRSITAAVTVMVPNSLGPGKLLMHYGTREQKEYYLPRLARGEEIPCFALTGPDAGSDAGAIPDRGEVCHGEWNGENVLGVRLNWEKRYITLGPVCTLIGLAFKLYDPQHLLGDEEDLGVTIALVPRDTPGVSIGERHVTLDIPFQNGPNSGRDVFVPISQLIGGTEYVGQGWRMLVECLAEGRGISLPALSVGAGKTAARFTGAYAAIRRQFNQPIGRFEGVEEPLARIAALTYQMDAARTLTLGALDIGEKPSVISAIVKYHLTEKYRRCINDAMDIQGGSGICLGPSNLVGRAYQAIPIAITVEGANILTRSMIIFGQGAVRAHPWVLREFQAVQEPDPGRGLQQFDHAIFGHVGFMLGNVARSLFLGLTRGRLAAAPVDGPTRRYYQQLSWMSAAFALSADVAMMTLGGSLKRKERLSARLGDVLSELYLTSAVLKRFEDQGRPQDDLPLVTWACETSFYQMQESLRLLFRNLPLRPLAWLLRAVVFPTGTPYTAPRDGIDHAAAGVLLKPGAARDRLTRGIFTSDDRNHRQGQIELAFTHAARVAPIERTLRDAKRAGLLHGDAPADLAGEAVAAGIIDEADARALHRMAALRRDVVMVDSFAGYGKRHALGPTPASKPTIYAVKGGGS